MLYHFFACQVGGYLAEVKTTSQMELLLGLAGMQAITQPLLYSLLKTIECRQSSPGSTTGGWG